MECAIRFLRLYCLVSFLGKITFIKLIFLLYLLKQN